MKKSTVVIIVTGLVALVLSIITGVISLFLIAGAAKEKVEAIDVDHYVEQVQEWVDENIDTAGSQVDVDSDGNKVHVGTDGIHVESEDGTVVEFGTNGIDIK